MLSALVFLFWTHLIQSQWRVQSKTTTDEKIWGDVSLDAALLPDKSLFLWWNPNSRPVQTSLMTKDVSFSICHPQCSDCISVFSSGAGLQRTEPSGNHHHCVRGRPHHAALHGSGTADLEKVNIKAVVWNVEKGETQYTVIRVQVKTRSQRCFLKHAPPLWSQLQ